MRFTKFHGYGNDYLVFEAAGLDSVGWRGAFIRFDAGEPFPEFVRRVCDRHFGAGPDSGAVVERLAGGGGEDFALRIFKRYVLRGRTGEGSFRFEAEIGRPRFDSASVPILTPEPLAEVRDYQLALPGGERVAVTALQMCNPNCCVFVEDFDGADWRRLGRALESHAAFPERTNVEFVRVIDRRSIEARVWERGAGETLSSGTGACAAAVASMVGGRTDRHVRVSMPGGLVEVLWREDGEVLLTGTAEVVYRGEWLKG